MSETSSIRNELRKSLVQHVFHYFEELKKTNSEANAQALVIKEINSLKELFTKEEASVSFLTELTEQETYWNQENKKARTKEDIDRTYFSEDVLSAIKVLKLATKGESHGEK